MKIKPYSDDLYAVFQRAAGQSKKYWHTHCGTPHLFLSTFGFLSQQNGKDPRYTKVYEQLKNVLNSFGVDGKTFEKVFLDSCPRGEEPGEGEEFRIQTDREFDIISQTLSRRAVNEARSMEIEDMILELFADRGYTISMILEEIVGSNEKMDEMYSQIQKIFKKVSLPKVKELEEIKELTNLNEWVSKNPRTTIGVDEDIQKLEMALSGRSIKNAILVGPAGTGKTEVVYEFVQRINNGEVADDFLNRIVYQLDSTALIAGTRFRGDMEEKLNNILKIVKDHPEVLLFIDELHSFCSLGGSSDGSQSAGNMIKPFITRGEIQLIGCTTSEEYTKHILADKAFARRFHKLLIQEPSREDTIEILKGILPVETEYFGRECQLDLIERIVDLSDKYTLDQANPAKAINMLELAFAYTKVFTDKATPVDLDAVMNSVKLRYNVFMSKEKLEDTRKELFSTLLGQDAALEQILRNLKIVEKGVVDRDKPQISFLLAGPTGTGKTEACKVIAKNYFGSSENLIKINCGEYANEIDVTKISGSSAGYVGYEDEPYLIKSIREKPNSLVLFDEIEKAHKSIQKIILNILDEGEMVDNKGNKVSFKNAIIVFTTNLGCDKTTGKATGAGLIKTVKDSGNNIMKAIEDHFSPEFLGRLDDIVFYNPLSKDIATTLINRYLAEYNKSSGLNTEFTQEDIDKIVDECDIETRGARGLRKAVRKHIVAVEDRKESVEIPADSLF